MSDFCLSCEVIFTPKVIEKIESIMRNRHGGLDCPFCQDEMFDNKYHNKDIDISGFDKTIVKNGIPYYPLTIK